MVSGNGETIRSLLALVVLVHSRLQYILHIQKLVCASDSTITLSECPTVVVTEVSLRTAEAATSCQICSANEQIDAPEVGFSLPEPRARLAEVKSSFHLRHNHTQHFTTVTPTHAPAVHLTHFNARSLRPGQSAFQVLAVDLICSVAQNLHTNAPRPHFCAT